MVANLASSSAPVTRTPSPNGPGWADAGRRDGAGAGLVTPEAVELDIATASVGLRGLAYIIDLVVLGVAIVVVLLVGLSALSATGVADPVVWIIVLSIAAMWIVVPMVVEAVTTGRSLGKRIAKLRVVTVEAGPIGWRHAAIRATVGLFELIATSGVIGFFVALATPRGQRLGDLVAGTLVVREAVSRGDVSPVRFRPVQGTEWLAAMIDASDLDEADYQVIRATLLRTGLPAERHAALCATVTTSLWPRVGPSPLPTSVHPQAVLTAIAAAYQDRFERSSQDAADWIWDHDRA